MHVGIARPTHVQARRSRRQNRRNRAQKSSQNQRKVGRSSTETRPKSVTNRRKFDLGQFWALQTVLGTRRVAIGTRPGCPKAASGWILGRSGRAKGSRETSKSVPGPTLRRSQTTREPYQSGFSVKITVERACRTIFLRFVLSSESSKLKIRAPTQCFVRIRRSYGNWPPQSDKR